MGDGRAPASGLLLALLTCWLAPAVAAESLQQWRLAVTQAGVLAEQDVKQAHAQAQRLQAAPPEASGADRTSALNLLARTEMLMANTDAAGELAARALAQARQQGDRIGQAEANLVLARNTVNQGRIDRLYGVTTDAMASLDGLARPALLAEVMLHTSLMYNRQGKLDESVAICVQALEIARLSAVPRALAFAHRCMGLAFGQAGKNGEAMPHYLAMASMARQDGSRLLLGEALLGEGNLLVNSGEPRRGEAVIREALALFRELDSPFNTSNSLYSLGAVLSQQGRHAEALQAFGEGAAIYQRHPNPIAQWWALSALSAEHDKLGNPGAARGDAEAAYQLAQKVGQEPYLGNSARQLAALAARRGDYRQAYAYLREAGERAARIARAQTGTRVMELAARYESESKQRRIDALTRSNASQQLELERRAGQQRWMWTVLGGSLALLVCIVIFMTRLRRSHRLVARLNADLERTVQQRTAELRQQSRYLRVLIDTLPWWVWFKDTDSRYLAVNRTVAATWSRGVDDMVGLSEDDVMPGLAAHFRQEDLEVMATRQARTVETRQMGPDGLRWVETFKAAVVDEDGSVLGTVGLARDITERKQVEAAREAALEEARQLARLRSEFLAQMSHELRTPLNGILGYSQLLRRDPALSERQRAGASVIHDSGEHLLTLINDLLDSAKIEANKLEAQPAPVALRQCLQVLADMVRVSAEQKRLRFDCEIGAAVPAMVLTDERRLRQALLNLLANAVKFTDQGGVSLRVNALGDGRLRFEVTDSGVGIEAGQRERIFLPFEQAGELLRRQDGTGLGLAISRQFVRLLGGEISLDSQLGQGCRFWFDLTLPVIEAPAPELAPPQWITGYHGARRRLLVADDQPGNRRLLYDMLAPLGFLVDQVGHGQAVLDQLVLQPPDLILLDIAMPGMNGLETVRRLRADPAWAGLPVVAVSASAGGADRQQLLDAGFSDRLSKPVDLDLLLAVLRRCLQLDWRHRAPPPAPGEDGGADLLAPPPEEMVVLHDLAQLGNMRAITERADYLQRLDPRYRPFAAQLRQLARGYQSQALLQLVEHHLGRTP